MRTKIGRRAVDQLQVGQMIADDEIPGFCARRLPSKRVQYFLRYQVDGKRRFMPLGLDREVSPEDARKLAARRRVEVRAGQDPAAEAEVAARRATDTVKRIGELYIEKEAKPRLRSWQEIERQFTIYINPEIGETPMLDLRRGDVTGLLDKVEKENGPVMCDRVLATVRRLCNWYAVRVDDFVPPIVRGMARTRPRERARDRVLSALEIRKIWAALESTEPAVFGPFVKMLFLTAARRGEVAAMEWREIAGANWISPGEKRKAKRAVTTPLSEPAQKVLASLKRRRTFVFSTDGGATHFRGFSKAKRALDVSAKVSAWTLHDIRRTCRSLMSAAGVAPDVAERVLGHVIPGVAGVYDRHDYAPQKAEALKALGDRIAAILEANGEPQSDVKTFARKRKSAAGGTG